MARLLVYGLAPLPYENELKSFGPGVRTWQIVQPLVGDGHDVTLVTWRIPHAYQGEHPEVVDVHERGLRRLTVTNHPWSSQDFHKKLLDEVKPDALLGATIYGSHAAVSHAGSEPVWVDLFGHVMAEAQAKAAVDRENHSVPYFWTFEREVILRGDAFSTVGDSQGFATIGELGAAGRLRKETLGYRFVNTIPCALDPEPLHHRKTVLRGMGAAPEDFVLLWSGGYNTWTDVDTLFCALERAMVANASIRFVSTGGAIDGHDDETYPRFLRMIEGSRRRDQFVMKGWIAKDDATDHYFEADLGVNIDRFMYEGMLGSKNRILDWMRAGLPCLAGELSEISHLVKRERLGFTFPLEDPEALAAEILRLADRRDEVREAGRRAHAYGMEHLTFEATTGALRSWCRAPHRSPDAYLPSLLDGFSAPAYMKKLEGEVKRKTDYIVELEEHIQKLAGLAQEKDARIAQLSAPNGNGTPSLGKLARRSVGQVLRSVGMGPVIERIRKR